jgi:hypothetical protein
MRSRDKNQFAAADSINQQRIGELPPAYALGVQTRICGKRSMATKREAPQPQGRRSEAGD